MLKKELWVGKKNREGGSKIVIQSTSTSTLHQSLSTKQAKKKKRHKQPTQYTYVKLLDRGSCEKLQNVC